MKSALTSDLVRMACRCLELDRKLGKQLHSLVFSMGRDLSLFWGIYTDSNTEHCHWSKIHTGIYCTVEMTVIQGKISTTVGSDSENVRKV